MAGRVARAVIPGVDRSAAEPQAIAREVEEADLSGEDHAAVNNDVMTADCAGRR
jgi:hypothetical protein